MQWSQVKDLMQEGTCLHALGDSIRCRCNLHNVSERETLSWGQSCDRNTGEQQCFLCNSFLALEALICGKPQKLNWDLRWSHLLPSFWKRVDGISTLNRFLTISLFKFWVSFILQMECLRALLGWRRSCQIMWVKVEGEACKTVSCDDALGWFLGANCVLKIFIPSLKWGSLFRIFVMLQMTT